MCICLCNDKPHFHKRHKSIHLPHRPLHADRKTCCPHHLYNKRNAMSCNYHRLFEFAAFFCPRTQDFYIQQPHYSFKHFYSRLILFKLCRFFSSPPWVLALDQTGGDIHLSMYCFTISISNRCSIYLLSLLLT